MAAAKRRRVTVDPKTEEVKAVPPAGAALVASSLFGTEAPNDAKAMLYRLPAAGVVAVPAVRERFDRSGTCRDVVADFLGFPSPFSVVDLADARGVWHSKPLLVTQLGEDPRGKQRAVHALKFRGGGRDAVAPAGLRNLGATCYLNSLLQYLFFNADFRACLLHATSGSGVVTALQRVFALMMAGGEGVVDPGEFVQAAGVEAGEQEDATEFSALLLDWLERELGKSASAATAQVGVDASVDAATPVGDVVVVSDGAVSAEGPAQNQGEPEQAVGNGKFIPALFQGEVAQLLTCLKCPDHFFERRETFYELRASLKPGRPGHSGAASRSTTATARAAVVPPRHNSAPAPPMATVVAPSDREASFAVTGVAQTGAASASTKKLGKKKESSMGAVRLEDLLTESAFPDEMMSGDNQYHCPKCDCKVDARKSLRLARPPPYLHVTVERYHYDQKKGLRTKLNSPVSFPQRLQLRLCRSSGLTPATPAPPSRASPPRVLPVMYECIGYLEHVSDSAHSGHYTATLYQEEEDAPDAQALSECGAPSLSSPDRAEGAAAREPGSGDSSHRLRRSESGPDAAAGAPRQGIWWSLDDDVVMPVTWRMLGSAESSAESCASPQRIESSSAYLLLYRRSDHKPGDLVSKRLLARAANALPSQLAEFISTTNGSLDAEQREFDVRSAAVNRFLSERKPLVDGLVAALREARPPSVQGAEGYSVVPSAWLNAFLHGEDIPMESMIAGDTELRPVSYGASLLRSGDGLALDPLAVLCGEVTFVPAAALDTPGFGGLDSALFVDASQALSNPCCVQLCELARAFWEEWQQIGRILREGKINLLDARALQSDGCGDDAVWIALSVQKAWQKAGAGSVETSSPNGAMTAAMHALLREAHATMWGGIASQAAAVSVAEEDDKAATSVSLQGPLDATTIITDGLLCVHGLVCNTKAGFLAKRGDVERLLELSAAKAAAYCGVWPELVHRGAPQLLGSCAAAGGRLFGFVDTCFKCHDGVCSGGAGATVGVFASTSASGGRHRRLQVRRRYPSGVVRKQGIVELSEDPAAPVTGSALRALVLAQLSLPVAKLHVQQRQGSEAELQDAALLGSDVEDVVIERDESTPPSREATAFLGSVFRGG